MVSLIQIHVEIYKDFAFYQSADLNFMFTSYIQQIQQNHKILLISPAIFCGIFQIQANQLNLKSTIVKNGNVKLSIDW